MTPLEARLKQIEELEDPYLGYELTHGEAKWLISTIRTLMKIDKVTSESLERIIKGVAMHHKEFEDDGSFVFDIVNKALKERETLMKDLE